LGKQTRQVCTQLIADGTPQEPLTWRCGAHLQCQPHTPPPFPNKIEPPATMALKVCAASQIMSAGVFYAAKT